MVYYRLYHLNRASGRIDRAEEIEAADDVSAVAIARERERTSAAELWQQGRKVLRLDPPTSAAPARAIACRPAIAGSPNAAAR